MPDDLNAAITSAVAEAKTEAGGDTAPEPEVEATPEPEAPEPKEPVKAPEPDDEEFLNPTAEELAAIEADPRLKKVYNSMRRGMSKKAQELAEKRKTMEQESQVVNWLKNDPENAIRAIAQAAGIPFGEAKKQAEERVIDDLEAKWAKTVGAEPAKLLRPLFEETAKALLEQEIAPVKAQNAQLMQAATERGIAASVREFGALISERGEEWDDEIQADMAKIADTVEPGEKTSLSEYIAHLYDTAIARRLRTKQAKSNLERLRRVRTEAEPTTTTRSTPASAEKITNDMSDKDAIAIAVRQAKQSLNARS